MSDLLRRQLRLSAARAEPTAYPRGARVQMHSWNNTQVWRGSIMTSRADTPADHRRVLWDAQGPFDEWISTIPVTRLELIEE